MRKLILSSVLSLSLLCGSCLGSFNAVSGLKAWNDDISNDKFVNNLVFWGLNIIPVYGLFVLGDALIFNVIEFWSGSNPIAMKDGDMETQIVKRDGNTYKMTATKNRMTLSVIKGQKKGNKIELVYLPEDSSWNAVKPDGEVIKLATFEEGFYIVYLPDGEKIKIAAKDSNEKGLAILHNKISNYCGEGLLAQLD